MSLLLLEGTRLYWVINLNVDANFIALLLEESRSTNISAQIAWPTAQTPRPRVLLRNFKQDSSTAASLPSQVLWRWWRQAGGAWQTSQQKLKLNSDKNP